MSVANYAARVNVHPDRYGTGRPMPPRWCVLHTSEGGSGPGKADQLAAFLTTPGDRPTSSGGRYGSSYHAIADAGLRVIPATRDERVAYSAPGANTEGLHICIPGRASTSRAGWLEGHLRSTITTVAAWLIDQKQIYGIPTERLTVAELQAGTRGYTDHAGIRDAFGRTTHYDVGPHFPWDVLHTDIRALSSPKPPNPPPSEEDDTVRIAYVQLAGTLAVYNQWSNGTKTWIHDPAVLNVLRFIDPKLKITELPNADWMRAAGPIVGPVPARCDGWGVPIP